LSAPVSSFLRSYGRRSCPCRPRRVVGSQLEFVASRSVPVVAATTRSVQNAAHRRVAADQVPTMAVSTWASLPKASGMARSRVASWTSRPLDVSGKAGRPAGTEAYCRGTAGQAHAWRSPSPSARHEAGSVSCRPESPPLPRCPIQRCDSSRTLSRRSPQKSECHCADRVSCYPT